jgi:glycogen debranching enzyme
VALHAAWQATGDRSLIERHLPNAEACLTWIDKYGDRDGDGFQEYQTQSGRKTLLNLSDRPMRTPSP